MCIFVGAVDMNEKCYFPEYVHSLDLSAFNLVCHASYNLLVKARKFMLPLKVKMNIEICYSYVKVFSCSYEMN